MIRVLIADDEALVRGGLRMILDGHDDIEVVGEAADGAEALDLVRRRPVDVVLMDIRMHPVDGLEATRRLGNHATGAPRVLVLTTFDLDEYVYEALRAGASGFLLKTTPPQQLADAVRTVARGDALLSPAITRRVVESYVTTSQRAREVGAALSRLTEREHEVLVHIARGCSNAEIAEALFLGQATVKTHVNRLLAILGLRDRVQAVVFAYEAGVVRPGHNEPGR